MGSVWQALRQGESAPDRRRQLARAHDHFTSGTAIAEDPELREHFAALTGMRPVVFESWLRSQRSTIAPDRVPDQPALGEEELQELRRRHPIARVLPLVQRLLFDEAAGSGLIVAVGDAAGRLLWVDGDAALRSRAEEMGFRAGMDWSERAVGTSAPGSALALDHAIQVLGAEHYNRFVHQWSCTAAPVHDPVSGSLIGVVDVTGGDSAASPHLMPLLEATIAAVEAELKFESLRDRIERERAQERPPRRASHRPFRLGSCCWGGTTHCSNARKAPCRSAPGTPRSCSRWCSHRAGSARRRSPSRSTATPGRSRRCGRRSCDCAGGSAVTPSGSIWAPARTG